MRRVTDRKRVLVTRAIPKVGLELLEGAGYEVEINPDDRPYTREEFLEKVAGREGVVCMLHDPIDDAVLDAATDAKIFSNFAVGYNNIDLAACRGRGVRVTNTPGVLTDATADLAFCLLLATARRVVETDAYLREGKFRGWAPLLLLGADVTGKTLGIVGPGRIGKAVAERAKGFRMRILYSGRSSEPPHPDWEALGAEKVKMEELLSEADFVSIHCPLTEETRHLIGDAEFARMKSSAILINTARGPIVDEAALVRALADGEIAGAGLDVFEEEPRLAPGLADLPNTVLLPHLGSSTHATRDAMARLAAENLIAVLEGREPAYAVV